MGMSTTSAPKFVAYLRVSTTEQGISGLGIEAQRHAVEQHAAAVGGVIVKEFVEVASGDDDQRPILAAALKLAKRMRATILVAKLDRLSRAVALVAKLMRDGTQLRVAECAGASSLELHIRAVISQEEREKIAARTSDALQAAKRRGVKLGSARPGHWKGREHIRTAAQAKAVEVAAAKRQAERAEVFTAAMPIAKKLHAAGESLRAIAVELNAQEISTSRGTKWHAAQVSRLLTSAS